MQVTMSDTTPIRRALISVSDKAGIVDFAKALQHHRVEILSTGGTAKQLRKAGIDVIDIADYTGFPEMMDGRVKTLHPKIHGGLLYRPGIDDAVMTEHGITPIDLVVVNLYPFEEAIRKADCSLAEAIENIDIGGPTLLRAAAKNHAQITVVVDSDDYATVLDDMQHNNKATMAATRFRLAQKAFIHTARYDAAITNYLTRLDDEKSHYPSCLNLQFYKQQDLRYGENPHQTAAFYRDTQSQAASISSAQQHQGKTLSYNNIADTDTALECVKTLSEPACVIVKHANPCGVAIADDQRAAYQRAYATDPTSSFGGIIAFNTPLTKATASAIIKQQFVEVIIAPSIDADALTVTQQKPNVRVLSCGAIKPLHPAFDTKRVSGGLLVQDLDLGHVTEQDLNCVTQRKATAEDIKDCLFAWQVVKFVKSNAIVYAKQQATVGIGAGQMSRVISAKIAAMKAAEARLAVPGSVMASDAFFPFRDSIDAAAEAGITAIIQPGGSIRDEEVIAAADEANIAMLFTAIRHFRH